MNRPKTVSLDPPWPEKGGGKIKRGADKHYTVIKKKEDILKVILQSGEWPDWDDKEGAHCYMWVTNNYLLWGLWLLEALGFRYITTIVWVKTKEDWPSLKEIVDEAGGLTLNPISWAKVLKNALVTGLGQYFRSSHELVLFGVRGATLKPATKDMVPTVFHAPRPKEDGKRKHSKKPERIFEIIEATSPGPYREFFARAPRKGWSCWGNEV